MSSELPSIHQSETPMISRRNLLKVGGMSLAALALRPHDSLAASRRTEVDIFSLNAGRTDVENSEINVLLKGPTEFYGGPDNTEFKGLSSEPLKAGTKVAIKGKFGDYFQANASYENSKGELQSNQLGYIYAKDCGQVQGVVKELTIDEVPWAGLFNLKKPQDLSNTSDDQLVTHLGKSYKMKDSDFNLDLSLDVLSFNNPNQNHGLLISNPNKNGDATNALAIVRNGEAWTLYNIDIVNQKYQTVTDLLQTHPDKVTTTMRVNKDGTDVDILYANSPSESFHLDTPLYNETRYIDLFANTAGKSELIVNKLRLKIPPSGKYQKSTK